MGKRKYTLGQRATTTEETRRRIVAATARLHERIGPRETTISAIADEAGVQRLTVYRHFPDETEIFKACSAHWLALNPLPDPVTWSHLEGHERVRESLGRLYSYFRQTARMWDALYRDEPHVAALKMPMKRMRKYLEDIRDDLADHFDSGSVADNRVRITLGTALQYSMWQSFACQKLDDIGAADLVCDWLRGVTQRPSSSRLRP